MLRRASRAFAKADQQPRPGHQKVFRASGIGNERANELPADLHGGGEAARALDEHGIQGREKARSGASIGTTCKVPALPAGNLRPSPRRWSIPRDAAFQSNGKNVTVDRLSEKIDAVVTAGGRLGPAARRRYGTDVKALVKVGGATLLSIVLDALRGAKGIGSITVVGPLSTRDPRADQWIPEAATGEENLVKGLEAASTQRVVVCASDLPFLRSEHITDFLSRVPLGLGAAYPIFGRAEFLREFPKGRTEFAQLADGAWTGGSVFVVEAPLLLARRGLISRAFRSRKGLLKLAALLGPQLALRFFLRQARVADVEARAARLLAGTVRAITGAHPALAMDCDDEADLKFAQVRAAFRSASR